jgi:hypothetical protein
MAFRALSSGFSGIFRGPQVLPWMLCDRMILPPETVCEAICARLRATNLLPKRGSRK